MVQEFLQALSRIKALKKSQSWEEAAGALDEEFHRLAGLGAQGVARVSETELLARLIRGEATQVVHEKTLLVTALLKEAGDIAAAQGRAEESHACRLKGLHLLLDVLAQGGDAEYPDFVPKVEAFVAALADSPLSARTQAMLMQHYERTGQFAKAEDALFVMLEADPDNAVIVDFGIAFYERLKGRSNAALEAGNLPRPEVETGLAERRGRGSPRH